MFSSQMHKTRADAIVITNVFCHLLFRSPLSTRCYLIEVRGVVVWGFRFIEVHFDLRGNESAKKRCSTTSATNTLRVASLPLKRYGHNRDAAELMGQRQRSQTSTTRTLNWGGAIEWHKMQKMVCSFLKFPLTI